MSISIKDVESLCLSKCSVNPNDKILIACSGGADSMILLHCLSSFFPVNKLHVATFNHNTREESKEEVNFVQKLVIEMGIGCSVGEGVNCSTEASAREERFDFLNKVVQKHNCTLIATGHNSNDRIETSMMNLMRGCGLSGFCSMSYRDGNIIRPILDFSRAEIRRFARNENIPFFVDPTNETDQFKRSRIRPIVDELFRSDQQQVLRSLNLIKSSSDAHQEMIQRLVKKNCHFIFDDFSTCNFFTFNLDILNFKDFVIIDRDDLGENILKELIFYSIKMLKGNSTDITSNDIEKILYLFLNGGDTLKTHGIMCSLSAKNRTQNGRLCIWNGAFDIPKWQVNLKIGNNFIPEAKLLIRSSVECIARSWQPGDKVVQWDKDIKAKELFKILNIPQPVRNRIPLIEVDGLLKFFPLLQGLNFKFIQ